jgi:hypothetical protein
MSKKNVVISVKVSDYGVSYTYSVEQIITTGFQTQQSVIKKLGHKEGVIKALVEGGYIPIDIFFFKKSDDKENLYSQPGIEELKEQLFPFVKKELLKEANLPNNVNKIGMAILPMSTWMQSGLLRSDYSNQISLFYSVNQKTTFEESLNELEKEFNRVKAIQKELNKIEIIVKYQKQKSHTRRQNDHHESEERRGRSRRRSIQKTQEVKRSRTRSNERVRIEHHESQERRGRSRTRNTEREKKNRRKK